MKGSRKGPAATRATRRSLLITIQELHHFKFSTMPYPEFEYEMRRPKSWRALPFIGLQLHGCHRLWPLAAIVCRVAICRNWLDTKVRRPRNTNGRPTMDMLFVIGQRLPYWLRVAVCTRFSVIPPVVVECSSRVIGTGVALNYSSMETSLPLINMSVWQAYHVMKGQLVTKFCWMHCGGVGKESITTQFLSNCRIK